MKLPVTPEQAVNNGDWAVHLGSVLATAYPAMIIDVITELGRLLGMLEQMRLEVRPGLSVPPSVRNLLAAGATVYAEHPKPVIDKSRPIVLLAFPPDKKAEADAFYKSMNTHFPRGIHL